MQKKQVTMLRNNPYPFFILHFLNGWVIGINTTNPPFLFYPLFVMFVKAQHIPYPLIFKKSCVLIVSFLNETRLYL